MSTTYVIGHKSPDLDSVAGAIAYAKFKNLLENTNDYQAVIAGEVNKETQYALDKFRFAKPVVLDNAKGKNIVMVDHNEFSQAVESIEEAKIKEILDHHKLNFKYSEPIAVTIKPWGSSCSIVFDLFKAQGLEVDQNLAGLMLSAILIDTALTKSPTTTEKDKKIISELATKAGIRDWQEYGMALFKVRSTVKDLTAAEILKSDFKDFDLADGKIGIGQVETVDLTEIESKENELLRAMNELMTEEGYHSVVLFLTDIINEGSKFLVATVDQKGVEKALGAKLENDRVYIEGIISRKKQVTPKFSEVFDK